MLSLIREGLHVRQRWVVWALVGIGWLLLFSDTLTIREANLDDVQFQRVVNDGQMWNYITMWGPAQGRYYGVFAFSPIWLLDSLRSPWLYQIVRLGLVATSLWFLGILLMRVTHSPELNLLWWLLWIGCLQIPPVFYALLSYPQMNCGLIFVLLAALSFWRALESPNAVVPWISGMLYFIGLQFNEAFLAFTFLFLFLKWQQSNRPGFVRSWRVVVPIGSAVILYLCIYSIYRCLYRNSIHYEGTQTGSNIQGALLYMIRYGASSLPGFELVIDRDPAHSAFRSLHEIIQRLSTVDFLRIPWALAVGAAASWLGYTAQWTRSFRQSAVLCSGLGITGLLFLSVPAVSAKYQVFAYHRLYPHAYNFILVHFMWASIAVAVFGIMTLFRSSAKNRKVIAIGFGFVIGTICLIAQTTNRLALDEIRQTVGRRGPLKTLNTLNSERWVRTGSLILFTY